MVRTRSSTAVKVGGKAPRKTTVQAATASQTPGSSKKVTGGAGNTVQVQPTPKWQKGISNFLAEPAAKKPRIETQTNPEEVDDDLPEGKSDETGEAAKDKSDVKPANGKSDEKPANGNDTEKMDIAEESSSECSAKGNGNSQRTARKEPKANVEAEPSHGRKSKKPAKEPKSEGSDSGDAESEKAIDEEDGKDIEEEEGADAKKVEAEGGDAGQDIATNGEPDNDAVVPDDNVTDEPVDEEDPHKGDGDNNGGEADNTAGDGDADEGDENGEDNEGGGGDAEHHGEGDH